HADAVVFRSEMVFQHAVFAFALVCEIAADDLVQHDGVQTAGGQVHEGGDVIAEGLQILEAGEDVGFLLDGVHGAAAFLRTDDTIGQVGLGLDGRCGGYHDDLVVGHAGLREVDVLLAFFGNGQAVPQNVNALAVEFRFLGAPVDGLEFDFHAQSLGGFTGQVDVKAD